MGLYAARCVRHAADVYQPREPTRGLAWEQAARTEKLAALHALEAELQAAQADASQYADSDPKKLEAVRASPPQLPQTGRHVHAHRAPQARRRYAKTCLCKQVGFADSASASAAQLRLRGRRHGLG